jgi:acyl carrier protein
MDIEHTFKIEIDENDEENCHTVDSLVKMIEDKQNGNT